jgi:hypothetical protein
MNNKRLKTRFWVKPETCFFLHFNKGISTVLTSLQ